MRSKVFPMRLLMGEQVSDGVKAKSLYFCSKSRYVEAPLASGRARMSRLRSGCLPFHIKS